MSERNGLTGRAKRRTVLASAAAVAFVAAAVVAVVAVVATHRSAPVHDTALPAASVAVDRAASTAQGSATHQTVVLTQGARTPASAGCGAQCSYYLVKLAGFAPDTTHSVTYFCGPSQTAPQLGSPVALEVDDSGAAVQDTSASTTGAFCGYGHGFVKVDGITSNVIDFAK